MAEIKTGDKVQIKVGRGVKSGVVKKVDGDVLIIDYDGQTAKRKTEKVTKI